MHQLAHCKSTRTGEGACTRGEVGNGEESEAGKEEARQGRQTRKRKREEANLGGGTKRGSALRTKLKSRGSNSSDLKPILYY